MMTSSQKLIDTVINQPVDDTLLKTRQSAIIGFYSLAVLFNLCLSTQVLTVGLAYFYNAAWWTTHVWLVQGYGGLSIILLTGAYWIPFPKRIKALTVSFPILLGLQFLTIHLQTPLPVPLAIFHPFIGFSLFSASATLVHRVWHIIAARREALDFV